MVLIDAYKEMLMRYVDFTGRTDVKMFWFAFLGNVIITAVLGALSYVTIVFAVISYIYSLAVCVPTVAIIVRRLRDGGNPWQNIFLFLIPVYGIIAFIQKCTAPSV